MIVAFAICNIHAPLKISEGGQLGVELLFLNWFGITPAITSVVIDFIFYFVGIMVLNKRFILNALVGTISYSVFYLLFQNHPFLYPFLSNNLFLLL